MTNPFSALWRQRTLVYELTKRDIHGRYRGASFGMLWTLISPFLMLCIYTLAFGFIFNSRWPGGSGARGEFALVLFVALIVHGFFTECFARSPGLVLANPNFVKRVVFPLEILPWPMIGSALFHTVANVLVLLLMMLFVGYPLHATILLLPLVLLPLVLMMLGLGWLLASLGVYFRDIGQLTGVVGTAVLFLSSAFIPLQQLPPEYAQLFRLNPLTFFIDQARAVTLFGLLPDWFGLVLFTFAGIAVAWIGSLWFGRTRRGFADVI